VPQGTDLLLDVGWLNGDRVWQTKVLLAPGNDHDLAVRQTLHIVNGPRTHLSDRPELSGVSTHRRWSVGVNGRWLHVQDTQASHLESMPFLQCPAASSNRTECMDPSGGSGFGCYWEADSRLAPGGTGPRCDYCATATDVPSECTSPADPDNVFDNTCTHEKARGGCRSTDCPSERDGAAACAAHPSGACAWSQGVPTFSLPVGRPAPGSQFTEAPVACPSGDPIGYTTLYLDVAVSPSARPGDALYVRFDGPPGSQQYWEVRIAVPQPGQTRFEQGQWGATKQTHSRYQTGNLGPYLDTPFGRGEESSLIQLYNSPAIVNGNGYVRLTSHFISGGSSVGTNLFLDPADTPAHWDCWADMRIWQTAYGAWNVTGLRARNHVDGNVDEIILPLTGPGALDDTLPGVGADPSALLAGFQATQTACTRNACPAASGGAVTCSATDALCGYTAGTAAPVTQVRARGGGGGASTV
jgi:hypothetical protein